jgi:hypothetical protein
MKGVFMVDYKRILRLRAEGASQRGIAEALRCSRNTVAAVFASADDKLLGYKEVAPLDNGEIRHLLYPELESKPSAYAKPDFDYIHEELARTGVTLLLLWNEYANRSRESDGIPYQYSFFVSSTAGGHRRPRLRCASPESPARCVRWIGLGTRWSTLMI